jgi:hypothetical protein
MASTVKVKANTNAVQRTSNGNYHFLIVFSNVKNKLKKSSSIDSMIPVLAAVGKDVSEKCGWAISIFMGGPVPRAGGAIQVARYVAQSWQYLALIYLTYSLHLGKTEHGNSFADSHPTFQEMYMSPFTNFVRKVFRE